MSMSIALVLDPAFGARLTTLAKQMPVWIVKSPTNDQAVQVARPGVSDGRITTLHVQLGETPSNMLVRALYAIDEHHGSASQRSPYKTLWVYGSAEKPPPDIASELGFKSITATADGFKAEK